MKAKKENKYALLKKMCGIHASSGNEVEMKHFLLSYIKKNSGSWKRKPRIYEGKDLQDNIILVFGKPRTAIFAHMDSIGFTVRYGRQLVKIGGPALIQGMKLIGKDSKGMQHAELDLVKDKKSGQVSLSYRSDREFERGTELVYKSDWRETDEHIQCCYM